MSTPPSTHLPPPLYQGSVKDIFELKKTQFGLDGELLFRFSDRYSIFDWGTMPDAIPGKGAALAKMGCKLFEHLESLGIRTHYLRPGVVPEDMIVKTVSVPHGHPEVYQDRPINTLVPLEVIFRLGVPTGSSLLTRFKTEQDWLDAGFNRQYQENEDLDSIAVDVTTKLEALDRPLDETEAKKISGMNSAEWRSLMETTQKIANEIRWAFVEAGMKLWDGKLEFAFVEGASSERREFMLVDSIGLDELRATFQNHRLSKEVLRQIYRPTQWYQDLLISKDRAGKEFKDFCTRSLQSYPQALPNSVIHAVSKLYTNSAELLLTHHPENAESLKSEITEALKTLAKKSNPETSS